MEMRFHLNFFSSTSHIVNVWPPDKSTNVSTLPVIIVYASQPIFRGQLLSKLNLYQVYLTFNYETIFDSLSSVENKLRIWQKFQAQVEVIPDEEVPSNAPNQVSFCI